MADGQRLKARSESSRHNHGAVASNWSGFAVGYGDEIRRKKDCLFLTNEATMLLKTQGRENEQSQTKPISVGGIIGGAEAIRSSRRGSGSLWLFFVAAVYDRRLLIQ